MAPLPWPTRLSHSRYPNSVDLRRTTLAGAAENVKQKKGTTMQTSKEESAEALDATK